MPDLIMVAGIGFEPLTFGLWAYLRLILAFCSNTVFDGFFLVFQSHVPWISSYDESIITEINAVSDKKNDTITTQEKSKPLPYPTQLIYPSNPINRIPLTPRFLRMFPWFGIISAMCWLKIMDTPDIPFLIWQLPEPRTPLHIVMGNRKQADQLKDIITMKYSRLNLYFSYINHNFSFYNANL